MPHPILYEINTRCWLTDLSRQAGRPVTLGDVPESAYAEWTRLGFTHIWLMGVWTTGPRARAEALKHPDLRRAYSELLPDWQETDVGGSPYAIADYTVPAALGGEAGLKLFRQKLNDRGLKLLLDFVPNHLGLDHPWVRERPDLFIQSPAPAPDTFQEQTSFGPVWLAHGKDPYFPGWTDTVQLDYRRPATRAAMAELLQSVAKRCDGVRCDMAMLVLSDIFAKTWQHLPPIPHSALPTPHSPLPPPDFWPSAISTVKQAHPAFLLLAEAYWGLEGRLRQLGFDYTYDKELYDDLVARDPGKVQRHLLYGARASVRGEAHFLENHDEPRVASILSPAEHRAAALVILGSPGMRFLHQGQLEGARLRTPVQLLRRPIEPTQEEIAAMYEQLLTSLPNTAVGHGSAAILEPRETWAGNPTSCNFVLVLWQAQPPDFDLLVVNLAPHRSQCYAPLLATPERPCEGGPAAPEPLGGGGISLDLAGINWRMKDLLGPEQYIRNGDELAHQGLYLDLPEHGAQLFHFQPA